MADAPNDAKQKAGKCRIAVLVSGNGSNLQSIIDATQTDDYPAEVALVLSNNPSAHALERAKKADIPTKILDHRNFDDRESYDAELSRILSHAGVELVCLAGFMRLLSAEFVAEWHNRLINIHPSLLPAFKGLDTHQRAIDAGVKFSGCTVHFVRPEMDVGPIIIQAAVPIHPEDQPSTLGGRILKEEHKLYPQAIRWFAENRLKVEHERVTLISRNNDNAPLHASIHPPLGE